MSSEAAASEKPGSGTEPPKRFPKGVVLGKDGKPCRSCTSFAAWADQAKHSVHNSSGAAVAAAAAVAVANAQSGPPADCPPDVETLGRSTWTLLHSIAAQYPVQPTAGQQADIRGFMSTFSRLYPCWVCAEDFQAYLKRTPVAVASRDSFGRWLCAAHNEVNRKLGKNEFDCNLWEERWRTGWKDGRCD